MPIPLTCPQCGKSVSIRDEAAGKVIRCSCGKMIQVPGPSDIRAPKPAAERKPSVEIAAAPAADTSVEAKKPSLLLVLGGCGVVLALLVVFGVAVGVVVFVMVKPDDRAENKEEAVTALASREKDDAKKSPLVVPDPPVLDVREKQSPETPPRPVPPPRENPEVLSKSLATLDKLTIAVAPPMPDDAPTPDVWEGHTATIRGVAYTDDGRFVVSVSGAIELKDGLQKEDNSIRVWDARRGKQVRKLDGFREALDAVSVSPGGRFAVFGHGGHYEGDTFVNAVDHHVHLWDIQNNREVFFRKDVGADAGADKAEARFKGLDSSVFSTAFSPDRKRVVGVANSGKLVLWDAQSGESLVSGKVVAVARPRSDGGSLLPVSFTLSGLTSIQFTPDGRWLLASGADYTVRLFDVATGQQVHLFESHQDIVWAVATLRSKSGRLLGLSGGGSRQKLKTGGFVDGAKDYAIRLWDLETRREIRRFLGSGGDVASLTFCPNGRHFLSAGLDKTVRLWDIESGKLLRTYRGHTADIRSVSVSPDGRTAVSGGNDCTIRYWRLPATLDDLARALDKKDRAGLTDALRDLDTMGPETRGLYPKLMRALRQKDEAMGVLALDALRRIGQPDKAWVNDLGELLIGPLPAARLFAAESLVRLGGEALPALAALRKALTDSDPTVRRNVLTVLANLGADAREAAGDLGRLAEKETDGEIKTEVIHALGKIDGKNKVVLRHLRETIAGTDAKARTAALKSLLDLGPETDALEVCLDACRDATNRELARRVLEKMPLGKTEAPAVLKALENDSAEVRLIALALLGRLKGNAGEVAPALRKCLNDKEPRVRFEAALAVAALVPADKDAIAEVVPVLIEPMNGVKKTAGKDDKITQSREALARIGQPAVPALFKTLQDNGGDTEREVWTRYQVYLTLSALGSKAHTFQNRRILNAWAKKEESRAIRYNTREIYDAAVVAATSVKPAGR
jgi:WD40 repeat protein/HEAT repeat protein